MLGYINFSFIESIYVQINRALPDMYFEHFIQFSWKISRFSQKYCKTKRKKELNLAKRGGEQQVEIKGTLSSNKFTGALSGQKRHSI